MVNGQLGMVVRHLHRLAASADGEELSDGQLLDRFIKRGEEAAFAALVRRHGPMVLGVCRRILRDSLDAEDAFQATFLVLFRRARAIDRAGSLGSYLYTVAYHVALKAKAGAARRQRREKEVRDMVRTQAPAEQLWDDLQPLLDEELNRLPDRYRAAVVVCYLQGRTIEEAARLLGCPAGTVKSRLARARELLRSRLTRRGVALSAGLIGAVLAGHAAAAVPPALVAATVRTTVLVAAGEAAAPAVSLAEGVLKAMFVTRLKVATGLLLALATALVTVGVLAHQSRAEEPAGGALAAEPPAAPGEQPRPEPKQAPKPDGQTMTVSGHVLDPEGKPLVGAEVTVCARQGLMLSSWQGWASYRKAALGRTQSDKDGGYRLTVPRPDPLMSLRSVHVVATAAGHGLAWKSLDPDAERAEAELRLSPVQRVSGRLVGLQGEGAAGVTVHVAKVTRTAEKGERWDNSALSPPTDLPLSAATDAEGNFVLGGFGPGLKLELEIRDPRYERKDEWLVDTGDKKKCENLHLVLGAGRCVEGRVVYEDTGKPVPNARLMFANPIVYAKADEQGRFKVALYGPSDDGNGPVRDIGVHVFPHPGEPYLSTFAGIDFPRGVVHREVEVKLPRGVLVRGKVTEAGSGKPVAGAYVTHGGLRETYAVSGPDGSFQLGVPAGTGYLLVTHPSGEFIPQILGSLGGGGNNPAGGSAEKPAGDRCYFHAVLTLDVKKDEDGKEVNVTLRRGVTIQGRLVGPDEKPVAHAVLFVSAPYRPRNENTMHPVDVWNSRFELRGLDPERTYRLLFLDHPSRLNPIMTVEAIEGFGQLWIRPLLGRENKHGATVEVLPKDVKGELNVKLARCGSAKVRFVDGTGKPLAKYSPWLQLVVTPGPPIHQALQDKVLAADVITLTGRYGGGQAGDLTTDDKGYVTFEGLIPGATYRLKKTNQEPNNDVIREFTVEAGKTLELEVVVK
jgi:RNA polymerase sigma factor (sigma-70 family)